jgi:hypothetical protein
VAVAAGAAAGFGAEAYSERIDCFRSGLDWVVELNGLDGPLDDLSFDCELPKKSRPSNESPGLVGLVAAGAAGVLVTGFELGISAVLGLTGGVGVSSPNRSTLGAGCRPACGCCCCC